MDKIEILNESEIPLWNKFIEENEAGTIYHHDYWMKIIKKTYGHAGQYVVVKNETGRIIGGLPVYLIKTLLQNKISTVPCAQYCNPIVATKEHFIKLKDKLYEIVAANNSKFCEIKASECFNLHDMGKEELPAYCTFELDLNSELESIKKNFHKNCIRRPIDKTVSNGLKIKIAKDEIDVRIFYNLYLRMRKENGLLPQPYKFFSNLWKILPKDNIQILHAEYEKKIVSSILLLKFKQAVIYEYGAVDKKMTHLHPSHFLLWHAIKQAHEQGFTVFDFGRTAISNTGLMQFKARWGSYQRNLNYYCLPETRDSSSIRDKKMAAKIMDKFVSNSPEYICQLLGSFLYKEIV